MLMMTQAKEASRIHCQTFPYLWFCNIITSFRFWVFVPYTSPASRLIPDMYFTKDEIMLQSKCHIVMLLNWNLIILISTTVCDHVIDAFIKLSWTVITWNSIQFVGWIIPITIFNGPWDLEQVSNHIIIKSFHSLLKSCSKISTNQLKACK